MLRVAVVGAGIIGLAVAEELTRRGGVRVELFERNSRAAAEASWAAAGILDPLGDLGAPEPFLQMLSAGGKLVPDLIARLQADTGVDLAYRASGMLTLAFQPEEARVLERERDWLRQRGFEVERFSRSQVRELEPNVDGDLLLALWAPQMSQIDVTRFAESYRSIVERQGGVFHLEEPVARLLLEGDRVTGVQTEKGRTEADWVVNCAGPWAGFDEGLPWSVPAIPVRGQILLFSTPEPLFRRIVFSAGNYLVQRASDQLIGGTTVEYAGYDKRVTEEGRRSIQSGLRRICSRVDRLPLKCAWAGLRPDTPDHLPILGVSPLRGLLFAAGHFRSGILLAPLTGRLIADLITSGSCSLDLSPFSLSRFLAKQQAG